MVQGVFFPITFHAKIFDDKGEIDGGGCRVSILLGWFLLDGIRMVPDVGIVSHMCSIKLVIGYTCPW